MPRICFNCEKEYELLVNRRGVHKRMFCYSCVPEESTFHEKKNLKMKYLVSKSRSHKETLGCSVCGYNKFGGALDWHHENDNKERDPSSALRYSWDAYLKETDKCTLLCSNCHRELHG